MHQGVLHVLFDFGYHVDVIDKEPVKKVLGNVASIGNEFAKKILGECSVFQRFSVITIARCDLIVDDFTPVVDNNMQFESIKPTHGAFAFLSPSPHCPMPMSSFDMTSLQWGGIDERDACTLTQTTHIEKCYQLETYPALQLHKAIIRDKMWELGSTRVGDVLKIKSFQISVS